MKITTLLVEDNVQLAKTIVDYLAIVGIDCDFVSNGVAGMNLATHNAYHAILLDINLPKMNGLEVCEALREKGIETPILMLTARDTLADKLAGFDAGTDDYLVKPFQMEELMARVKALANRRSSQSKRLSLGSLVMDLTQKQVTREGKNIDITPTGWIILETLMRRSPQIVTRSELEYAIWQDDLPDTDLLKVHLYRLRQQVDKAFATNLIHTIPNHGFVIKLDSNNAP